MLVGPLLTGKEMHVLQFRSVLVSITKFINAKLCLSVTLLKKNLAV